MKGGWVYIVTNKPFGPLYLGVTNDISRRMSEHKARTGAGFAAKYGLTRLVHLERYEEILAPIQREKNIKHWSRAWKLNLIVGSNPTWEERTTGGMG